MKNILDKFVQKINTHLMFDSFFSENRAVYETLSKHMETEEPQITSQFGLYELHVG